MNFRIRKYNEKWFYMICMGKGKTVMAVGSDTLKGAREVYAAVKQHKDKVPGLSAVYDEMSAFFKKNKIKTTPASSEG